LPYALHVRAHVLPANREVSLVFGNTGRATAVFHVYDRLQLDRVPRRYTVEPHKHLRDAWSGQGETGEYDLWVLGPNGFHRHFRGRSTEVQPEVRADYAANSGDLELTLRNTGSADATFELVANAYFDVRPSSIEVRAGAEVQQSLSLQQSGHWYDFSVTVKQLPDYLRRVAGRVETGRHSVSDPALGGPAHGEQV
jgi:phospholipase C